MVQIRHTASKFVHCRDAGLNKAETARALDTTQAYVTRLAKDWGVEFPDGREHNKYPISASQHSGERKTEAYLRLWLSAGRDHLEIAEATGIYLTRIALLHQEIKDNPGKGLPWNYLLSSSPL